jgi:multicomponent K+:H+ antiporter subunit E/multicomponent Na+:H+ antiporter subunit E
MMRFLAATAALTAVYALALASANPWDLAIGFALSLTVLVTFRRFLLPFPEIPPLLAVKRAAHVPALMAATAFDIVRGTVDVARVVLGLSSKNRGGLVAIPRGERTETGVAVSGLLDTLSPGSVLIDIDPEIWTVHAIDASDETAVRADIEQFYDRFQRPVWP